jgi:hypothetical protein
MKTLNTDRVVEKLAEATTRHDGGPRAIRRIELELVDAAAGTVRLRLWDQQEDVLRLVYVGDTKAAELSGVFALVKTLFVCQQHEAKEESNG